MTKNDTGTAISIDIITSHGRLIVLFVILDYVVYKLEAKRP